MNDLHRAVNLFLALCFVLFASGAIAAEANEATEKPWEPVVGQEGRDVVWVPTPFVLVEKMLDMAKVTPQDFVMDLGSGDGRNVIAAAKRGARALGVEFNPKMVELSKQLAAKEGVADKATFVEGDMYEADISQATVMALFLLTENLNKLAPKFLGLRPGARIVINGFGIDGWEPDETSRADGDCGSWCTAHLFYVPAKVAGTWRLPQGELTLEQSYQKLSGTLSSGGTRMPITNGRMRGDEITFTAGGTKYTGRVSEDAMLGDNGTWRGVRVRIE